MTALVTGGGGFLGREICVQLRARGERVRSVSRGEYPRLLALGVQTYRGDLADRDLSVLRAAARDVDVVYHVAAKAGMWGRYDDFFAANVIATRNVIAVCRELGIPRLVYTSTPSVVFDGRDMENATEATPYAPHYEAPYAATKAIAEQELLAANDATLRTVALRPHLVWGPRDNHIVPRLVARAKARRLRIVGDGQNLIDSTYIENAAAAHLCAADALAENDAAAGRAFFISNGEPLPAGELINRILAAAGLPTVTKHIPVGVAVAAGGVCEFAWRFLRLGGEPPMTRWVARELATAHWFDISAARALLGYAPEVSINMGLAKLADWYRAGCPA